jgi:hypothetical protein
MSQTLPDQSDRIGELLVAEFLALPVPERPAAALRAAAQAVEFAAYEMARSGDPRKAPKLILLSNDLLRMSAA